MNIDVAKAIKELLFDHDAVILPGLGGFTAAPVSATVDYVIGSVQPPSKKLEFNTNLVINDGVLVNQIQQSNLVTAQEASMIIENYVVGIKESLEAREIVDIPEIGRLYKDYEQKIRFMPDSTNFEVESFGLPMVKFTPVVRKRKVEEKTITTPKITTPANSTKEAVGSPHLIQSGNHWAEKMLPILIIVAAVLLAISMFVWFKGCGSQSGEDVPQARVNVKPKPENTQEQSNLGEDEMVTTDQQESTSIRPEQPEAEPPVSIEKPVQEIPAENNEETVPTPTAPNIFVVVHSFGSKINATNFAKTLEKGGYLATTKMNGKLYRVGVEVPYSRRNEIVNLIDELGRKFTSKPVVVDY